VQVNFPENIEISNFKSTLYMTAAWKVKHKNTVT